VPSKTTPININKYALFFDFSLIIFCSEEFVSVTFLL
jgi:hypothetical protein